MNNEIEGIVHKVHDIFTSGNLSLSAAESCTGGLVSHYITSLPGASEFFKAGVISYSKDSKKKLLNISEQILSTFGMVSRETARDMAVQARIISGTDYSIATTGNLGPDVLENKEKGLIFICVSKEGDFKVSELHLRGSRDENKKDAAIAALNLLIKFVTSRD